MYHTGLNPLRGIHRDPACSERVDIVRGERRRRLHKAFLRWHDPANWLLLREALKDMGRPDLIGNGKHQLIPAWQPAADQAYRSARRKNSTPAGERRTATAVKRGTALTQHTGLPPRPGAARKAGRAK
jgi:hypothetical protein